MLLIAPDSFKGTYSARAVAGAIARGVVGPVDLCPVGDGGEGTMEIVVRARGGKTTRHLAHDPLGRPILAALGWIDEGATAIVEIALASGLSLVALEQRDAVHASSYGTGELIAAAAKAGARRIVVALGGSATTDGGAGAIEAIEEAGGLRSVEMIAICDVSTPFERAAELYAAQKGADPEGALLLSERLNRCAAALPKDPRGVRCTGAAGGMAGGLWAMYDAELIAGAAWVLQAVGFDARLAHADAVITGEGRLDRQTFEGKLVGEIAARCARAGRSVHAVVGNSLLDAEEIEALGLASVHIASDALAMGIAGRAIASGVESRERS